MFVIGHMLNFRRPARPAAAAIIVLLRSGANVRPVRRFCRVMNAACDWPRFGRGTVNHGRRGCAPPPPSEFASQAFLVDVIRRWHDRRAGQGASHASHHQDVETVPARLCDY